ncbi:adiponectin receptor protein 1 [Apiospora arundinis]
MKSRRRPSTLVKPRLLTWSEILPWQRGNEYILTGYRAASFSHCKSLQSVFQLHNETSNIWSHLLGVAWFLSSFIQYLRYLRVVRDSSFGDSVALGVYYVAVIACFALSTFFHTFSDHSPGMHKFGNELDHLGIVLVLWGTGVSGAHFAFGCHEGLELAYIGFLSATALGCGVFTLRPKFRQPAYRTTRFLLYMFLGASLFAPIAHGLVLYGYSLLNDMMGLDSFLGLAIINFSGSAIYAARVPERWFPGTFDYIGQSHNLMHILVLMGALVRLQGLLGALEYWQGPLGKGVCLGLV